MVRPVPLHYFVTANAVLRDKSPKAAGNNANRLCFYVAETLSLGLPHEISPTIRMPGRCIVNLRLVPCVERRETIMNLTEAGARSTPSRFGFPTSYTILFGLIALAGGLTWIVPAGQYVRVNDAKLGREVAVRGSYHSTPSSRQTLLDVVKASRWVRSIFSLTDLEGSL